MKTLMILVMFCPPLLALADNQEVQDDRELIKQLEIMDKYRVLMTDSQSNRYFLKSIEEAARDHLRDCQASGGKDCMVLVNFLTRTNPTKPTYCYAVLLTGFMCEFHQDLTACTYYKTHKDECKVFLKGVDK